MSDTCPKCGAVRTYFNEQRKSEVFECGTVVSHDKIMPTENCYRNQLTTANAKYQRAVECLKAVEWEGDATPICPRCEGDPAYVGHADNCELLAILKEAEETPTP